VNEVVDVGIEGLAIRSRLNASRCAEVVVRLAAFWKPGSPAWTMPATGV
jgi:hypothetical protein